MKKHLRPAHFGHFVGLLFGLGLIFFLIILNLRVFPGNFIFASVGAGGVGLLVSLSLLFVNVEEVPDTEKERDSAANKWLKWRVK